MKLFTCRLPVRIAEFTPALHTMPKETERAIHSLSTYDVSTWVLRIIQKFYGFTSILDKPFCKPDQVQVYGVAKREKIRVSCDVISNPSAHLKFEWVFNSR